MIPNDVFDNVTGTTYNSALDTMKLINSRIEERQNKGFDSYDECTQFARENNLGVMAYSPSTKGFYHVNHKGELLTDKGWYDTYGGLLYYITIDKDKEKVIRTRWAPRSFEARNNALLVGEKGNGIREPLYERNYFLPTGYRNPLNGLWNIAKPVSFFAKETGADTSSIHTLLQHIAGNNYPYLLSWLRQKMMYPHKKTEVTPIFIGKQGTGKSSFGDAICQAMFGTDNVLLTHTFNGTSRFNADQVGKLVISIEEKTQDEKYNITSTLKALCTARMERAEYKGSDPYYQASHTEYVLTTNDIIPIKFDTMHQRRFMVMETNPEFRRTKRGERETETSVLADKIFINMFGEDRNQNVVGLPLWEQRDVMQQFKWELLHNRELPSCKDFIETDAYRGLYNIPRTTEVVTIESLVQSIAPFIQASLEQGKIVDQIDMDGEIVKLEDITPYKDAFLFVARKYPFPARVAVNQLLLFREDRYDKPYSHASIAKVLVDLMDWLKDNHQLIVLNTSEKPTNGGFKNCAGQFRLSPAIWFTLSENAPIIRYQKFEAKEPHKKAVPIFCTRYNAQFKQDIDGEFEVINPLKPEKEWIWDRNVPGSERNSKNVLNMATFLLEADEVSYDIKMKEQALLDSCGGDIRAEVLYKERLDIQRVEANRLMNQGIVRRIVYSGAKSIHMLVTVKDAPDTKEERKWLDAYLKSTLSNILLFDLSTSDAARLTRAPIERERITHWEDVTITGTQKLLKDSFCVYDFNWRPLYKQWLNNKRSEYEAGAQRKILPTKPIFKEATMALLDGTFWTDRKWHGQRQSTFFVAYRLVRSMGHSADDVWDAIKEDIQGYYKPKEIGYWLSRREGSLIQAIEREIEDE